jgi:hypothetical protein
MTTITQFGFRLGNINLGITVPAGGSGPELF